MSGYFIELRDRNVSSGYEELDVLARDLDYLTDIRQLEMKMVSITKILSKGDLLLRVETEWIELSPERYAPHYRSSIGLGQ